MELGFRKRLREMRGKKRQEQFAEEIGMSRSNYSLIEAGKSNPTIKTLEQIAKATNSTLVVDLIPNESEQLELEIEDKQQ